MAGSVDSEYNEYNLGYFTGNDVFFARSESFRLSDKNRFFQFYPHDSLTTVAISKVQLTGMKKDQTQNTTDDNVLTRSGNGIHAETQTVDNVKHIIKEVTKSGTKLMSLTLVMNITYSPCNNCQSIFEEFFENLNCEITFVLRFAYLYHGGVRGIDVPVEQLANWMIRLEKVCKMVRVESIEVSNELSSHSHRVLSVSEKGKEERKKTDETMKGIIRKVYAKKSQIEKENSERDKKAATSLSKMSLRTE